MKIGVKDNERREIIGKIGELEEKHCHNCELVKTFNFNYVSANCVKHCDIGKQLKSLGEQLDKGRTFNTGVILTKTKYLKLKLKDYEDKEIMQMYEVSVRKLAGLKQKWNLKGNQIDYGLELMNEYKKSHIGTTPLLG